MEHVLRGSVLTNVAIAIKFRKSFAASLCIFAENFYVIFCEKSQFIAKVL
jgi:hypothetical protein